MFNRSLAWANLVETLERNLWKGLVILTGRQAQPTMIDAAVATAHARQSGVTGDWRQGPE